MQEDFYGQCLCGEVTYHCTQKPSELIFCFCADCQTVSGGSPSSILLVARDSVVIKGDLCSYSKAGESGALVNRLFCPKCGTHMFSEPEASPDKLVVKAGTMIDPGRLRVAAEFWVESAQPWHSRNLNIKQVKGRRPSN